MKKNVKLTNGKLVEMRLTEEWNEITFYENGAKLSGEFEFIQGEFEDSMFLLARMYSPYPRTGLGEQALRFFINHTDGTIWTRMQDGITRSDGSHLTGNAQSFVMKMQNLNLIEEWDAGMYDDEI